MEAITVRLPRALRPFDAGPLVRLGQVRDGGYVVPTACIENADFLLSFGLSANWEFEKSFRRARAESGRQLQIHAYDHTVNARRLLLYRLKSLIHLGATRDGKYWRAFRMAGGYGKFFDKERATHFEEMVSWRDGPQESSIGTIMGRIDSSRRIFLSMDIEGHEYRVARDLIRYADRFVGLGIEFHDLDILRTNFGEIHEGLSRNFAVAHLHINNVMGLGPDGFPNVLEITYIHRSLLKGDPAMSTSSYPLNGLDMANVLDRPDYQVVFE